MTSLKFRCRKREHVADVKYNRKPQAWQDYVKGEKKHPNKFR